MIYYRETLAALDKEILETQISGGSKRLSILGDHDYIVGTVDGLMRAKVIIQEVKNKLEKLDDFDADEI